MKKSSQQPKQQLKSPVATESDLISQIDKQIQRLDKIDLKVSSSSNTKGDSDATDQVDSMPALNQEPEKVKKS